VNYEVVLNVLKIYSDRANNLAEILKSAILDWNQTLHMGINAAKKARYFSYENIAELYLSDFAQLIQASK
jgi:hypothetical protein